MAKGDDIQARLVHFSVSIIRLCNKLPNTREGGQIASQLLRCGTSPASNYAEARGAESDKDFVHKLKVVLKELNETNVWLTTVRECQLLVESELLHIGEECTILCRIIAASLNTMKRRLGIERQKPGESRV